MEGFVLLAVAVGLAASVSEAVRRRRLRRPEPLASPDDDPELDALFALAEEEMADRSTALISARLEPVVHRRVPVRAIRQAPVGRTARVLFADGTVILARGQHPGDMGQLSISVLMHPPVCLHSYHRDHDITRLEFALDNHRRVCAVAVGLDQAD